MSTTFFKAVYYEIYIKSLTDDYYMYTISIGKYESWFMIFG